MMHKKPVAIILAALTTVSFMPAQLYAWGCGHSCSGSGRYGGSFSHASASSGGWGSASHAGASAYTSPSGKTYTSSHSGSGSYGSGWSGSASYHSPYSSGSASYHAYGYGGGYHPPVAYPSYYGYHGCSYTTTSSCSNGSAFAAGLVTGAVVGAVVANSAKPAPAPVTYVYPSSGVYVAPAPVVYTAPVVVATPLPVGSTTTILPIGFASMNVNGINYYQSGPNWYQMGVGSNGVYYVVVRAP